MPISTCMFFLGLVAHARAGTMEGFIVGGNYTKIEKHPHSVFLSVHCVTDSGDEEMFVCGASILNQHIILTAAHCLYGCNRESHIGIHVGSENRLKGKSYTAYGFVVHERYDPQSVTNDIAMLKLEVPLKFNRRIRRVAVMRNPPYKEQATLAGWGLINENTGGVSDILKYIHQRVLNKKDCQRLFRGMEKGTICASAKSSKDYAAQGDSGSALTVRDFIQIGIVSYKLPTISNSVIIYTDVAYYYDWIKSFSQKLYCVK